MYSIIINVSTNIMIAKRSSKISKLCMMRMDGSHVKMMTKRQTRRHSKVVNSHIKQDGISLKLQQYAGRQNKWMRGQYQNQGQGQARQYIF
jgi:hypothetical protein